MSRFAIPGKHPGLLVTVGWDRPLQTFFAQVERPGCDSDDLVLWLGTRYREHTRPETMAAALSPYADLEPPILDRLGAAGAKAEKPRMGRRRGPRRPWSCRSSSISWRSRRGGDRRHEGRRPDDRRRAVVSGRAARGASSVGTRLVGMARFGELRRAARRRRVRPGAGERVSRLDFRHPDLGPGLGQKARGRRTLPPAVPRGQPPPKAYPQVPRGAAPDGERWRPKRRSTDKGRRRSSRPRARVPPCPPACPAPAAARRPRGGRSRPRRDSPVDKARTVADTARTLTVRPMTRRDRRAVLQAGRHLARSTRAVGVARRGIARGGGGSSGRSRGKGRVGGWVRAAGSRTRRRRWRGARRATRPGRPRACR